MNIKIGDIVEYVNGADSKYLVTDLAKHWGNEDLDVYTIVQIDKQHQFPIHVMKHALCLASEHNSSDSQDIFDHQEHLRITDLISSLELEKTIEDSVARIKVYASFFLDCDDYYIDDAAIDIDWKVAKGEATYFMQEFIEEYSSDIESDAGLPFSVFDKELVRYRFLARALYKSC